MPKTATAAARGLDLDPIDRLEEKIKLLVTMVERLKADQAKAGDENQRLTREVESLRGRLTTNEGANAELTALKEERNVIRSRVADMLEQLEALNV